MLSLVWIMVLPALKSSAQATQLFKPGSIQPMYLQGTSIEKFTPSRLLPAFGIYPVESGLNIRRSGIFPAEFMDADLPLSLIDMMDRNEPVFVTPGPFQAGDIIEIKGRVLSETSVLVDILDGTGKAVSYKETDVEFDQEGSVLRLKMPLKPGFYTLQIPVWNGVATKSIIVQ